MGDNNTTKINAAPNNRPLTYKELNEQIHEVLKKKPNKIILDDVCGQRFIAASLQGDLEVEINERLRNLKGNDAWYLFLKEIHKKLKKGQITKKQFNEAQLKKINEKIQKQVAVKYNSKFFTEIDFEEAV